MAAAGKNAEISGLEPSITLNDAIVSGAVPKSRLMSFNDWRQWRRDYGRRPTVRQDGYGTTTAVEARLWRDVMETLYGVGWTSDLATKEAGPGEESAAYILSGGG